MAFRKFPYLFIEQRLLNREPTCCFKFNDLIRHEQTARVADLTWPSLLARYCGTYYVCLYEWPRSIYILSVTQGCFSRFILRFIWILRFILMSFFSLLGGFVYFWDIFLEYVYFICMLAVRESMMTCHLRRRIVIGLVAQERKFLTFGHGFTHVLVEYNTTRTWTSCARTHVENYPAGVHSGNYVFTYSSTVLSWFFRFRIQDN